MAFWDKLLSRKPKEPMVSFGGTQVPRSLVNRMFQTATRSARASYDTARVDRTRADWGYTTGTPYDQISSGLDKLIGRSQKAYRDDSNFKAAIDSITNNVVGTGLRPKANVRNASGKPVKTINADLERGWARYKDEWDRRGQIDFNEGQRLAFRTVMVSGSILSNTVKAKGGTLVPIAKQLIEPSRLDSDKDWERVDEENNKPASQILHGIALDPYGSPVAYYFNGVDTPVSADSIICAYIQSRPEQYIGVPWGHAGLDDIWDIHQLREDTLIKSRTIADLALWLRSSDEAWGKDGDKDEDENRLIEKMSVIQTENKPEVIQFDDNVQEAVTDYTSKILHSAVSSLGTSYTSVTKDMEKVSFASANFVKTEEHNTFRVLQRFFATTYLDKEWADFVWWMVLTGQVRGLDARRFMQNPWLYTQVKWFSDGWENVNPLQGAQTEDLLVKSGLKSLRRSLADRGVTLEEHFAELGEEKAMIEKAGLTERFGDVETVEVNDAETEER